MASDKVRVRCPECGKKLTLLRRFQDKPISCPACERIFQLNEFEEKSPPANKVPVSDDVSPEHDSGTPITHTVNEQEHIRSYDEVRFSKARKFRKIHEDQRVLGEQSEAMQSIGIFLMIMAMLTTALPFFDLQIGGFAATGLLPVLVCTVAAISGTILLILSRLDEPAVPIGISVGYLLILVVVWCTVFDFNQFNPGLFNGSNPNATAAIGDAQQPRQIAAPTEQTTDGNNATGNEGLMVDHKNNRDNLPVGVVPGVDGMPLVKKKWIREEELEPIRPRHIKIPDDFDPDDDRFAPESFDALTGLKKKPDPMIELKERIRRGMTKDTIDLDLIEKMHVKKSVEIRKLTRKLLQHRIYRGNIDNEDFLEKYELSPVLGRKAVDGKVYFQTRPVIGVDVLGAIHGGGIDIIVPLYDESTKLESSQVAPADRRLGGLDLGFNDDLVVGVRGLFSRYAGKQIDSKQHMYSEWFGVQPREGREKQILSDGRTIYGFALFESERGVTGVALVYLKN